MDRLVSIYLPGLTVAGTLTTDRDADHYGRPDGDDEPARVNSASLTDYQGPFLLVHGPDVGEPEGEVVALGPSDATPWGPACSLLVAGDEDAVDLLEAWVASCAAFREAVDAEAAEFEAWQAHENLRIRESATQPGFNRGTPPFGSWDPPQRLLFQAEIWFRAGGGEYHSDFMAGAGRSLRDILASTPLEPEEVVLRVAGDGGARIGTGWFFPDGSGVVRAGPDSAFPRGRQLVISVVGPLGNGKDVRVSRRPEWWPEAWRSTGLTMDGPVRRLEALWAAVRDGEPDPLPPEHRDQVDEILRRRRVCGHPEVAGIERELRKVLEPYAEAGRRKKQAEERAILAPFEAEAEKLRSLPPGVSTHGRF